MGGFNIRTKYTGQDKHIQQDRDEKNKLRRQRQEEQNKRGEEEQTQYEQEHMGEFRKTLQLKQQQQQQQQQLQQQPQDEEEQPTLTEELFTEKLEDMEIQTTMEHKEMKNVAWTDTTRKRKKVNSDNEETQQTMKNKYEINADILKWILLNRAANLLPIQDPTGEFNLNNLLGLGYFYRDGRIQHTEGYVEGVQPDEDWCDPDAYAYWKLLSIMTDEDFQNVISGWVNQYKNYYVYA